ncbi:MAG TPA: DUF222 domain-containing protein, partial [Gemmatimonadales bacterium]|nr:DUF222 domain-containing protein [Gemmatimonadales bacterium]
VEVVAAWEKVAAWAHLGACLAAGELSRREAMNPHWSAPTPANPCVAGDELAMRLGWSRRAANRLVRDGRALTNELLLTADAVREGRLDTPKLRTVTDRLHHRPGQLAWLVQEHVLPQAAGRTPSQLAGDIDRALLSVDPIDAADRLPRALATRHVCHPKPLPDGMAGIWAVLPADHAITIDATLEASARTARTLGDPRTLDQLRADTLVTLATGHALPAGPTARDGGSRPTRASTPKTTRPEDDEADQVDAVEATTDESAAGTPAAPEPTDIRIPKVRVDVTVALSTLMGLDEHPGELAGYGPISADQARALAAGGVWRRLVTDPLSGQVLDVGRTRYRPPTSLIDHVTARDQVCAAPACSVPAHHCDIDHTTEYHGRPANGSPTPGTTTATNLGPLSNRCHRLKTDGGYQLTQTAPGIFEWHTPTGLTYRVTPGNHGHTQQLTNPNTTQPNPRYPDEPPF